MHPQPSDYLADVLSSVLCWHCADQLFPGNQDRNRQPHTIICGAKNKTRHLDLFSRFSEVQIIFIFHFALAALYYQATYDDGDEEGYTRAELLPLLAAWAQSTLRTGELWARGRMQHTRMHLLVW